MKPQRYHSLGLAVVSSLLVLLSGSNVVGTSSSSSPSSGCTDSSTSDGDCDLSNNTEECGYDGGDCCECTCISTTQYVCGVRSGFSCLDPSAACFVDDGDNDATAPAESDGLADELPTPSPTTTTPADETATAAPTEGNSTAPSTCIPDSLSDGRCDEGNNNEECGYDGGDCCECTCISTTDNGCGVATGFACFDPSASSSCVIEAGEGNTAGITGDDDTERIILLPDDGRTEQSLAPTWAPTPTAEGQAATPSGGYSTASSSSSCIPDSLSDGSCNADNNNQECGYDGGDCCECTCVSTSEFTCGDGGGYDCVDPGSSCEELSVENRNSAHKTAPTSSAVYLQLAMSFIVLSLRRLSLQ